MFLIAGAVVFLAGVTCTGGYRRAVKTISDLEDMADDPAVSEEKFLIKVQAQSRLLREWEIKHLVSYAGRLRSLQIVESASVLPVVSPPDEIFLEDQEQCHACFPEARLYEDVFGTQRSTVGGAVYLKVSKKITVRPSAYSGTSMPVAQFKHVDSGILLITNRRVVFQGQSNRLDIPLAEIGGVSSYSNGFQIQISGESKRQVFSVDPLEVRIAMTLISRLVTGKGLQTSLFSQISAHLCSSAALVT